MTGDDPRRIVDHLWIVGPGRLGLALGSALAASGAVESISFSGRNAAPPDHPLLRGAGPVVAYLSAAEIARRAPGAVLITVPDGGIADVAETIAGLGLADPVPVMHTSGALGTEPLAPLAAAGHPVGSIHPLAAVPEGPLGAERLRGAWFAVEGDPEARALATRLVGVLGGQALTVREGAKPLYHAAAVLASNYVVALLSRSEELLVSAGVERETAREAAAELAAGAVANTLRSGPAAALTGPIARGDLGTVELHLSRLFGPDRSLYSVLARQTLALARERGLAPATAAALERLLGEEA